MKKILYILPLALAALVSCQKEEAFTKGDNAVTINATIGEGIPLSHTAPTVDPATSWSNGDQIAVNNEDNTYVVYTYNDASWAAAPGEFLRWTAEEVIFKGYHPVKQGVSLTTFTLPTDQSDLAKISAADYMTVNESKTKPASGYGVDLNFTRKTARVIVKIAKFNNEFVGKPVISNLTITSRYARYDSGTTLGSPTVVTAYTGSDDTYIALVIPHNAPYNGDFINLDVTDDTGTQSLKLSTIYATEPGKSYTHNLTVGKQKIEVSSVTVADWSGRMFLPNGEAKKKCDDWDGTYATKFTAGFGTKENPYLIQTAEQLALLSTRVYNTNYSTGYFKLTTDIDLKYRDWTPIGSGLLSGIVYKEQRVFEGSFDGNGHTITGLKVTALKNADNQLTYVGLFGQVSPNYQDEKLLSIQNLVIRDAKIYAGSSVENDAFQGAGILAGIVSSRALAGGGKHTAKIKNCRVTGAIYVAEGAKAQHAGGLVGFIQKSEVTDCRADVTIDCNGGLVGGLFGYAFGSAVKNSHCKGSVKGAWSMGGFAGAAEHINDSDGWSYMEISDCTTSVDVTASNWNAGGFVGFMKATITNCSASGDVTSTVDWDNKYKTGGFLGTNAGSAFDCVYSGTLTYSESGAEAWKQYGGFTGNHAGGSTTRCRFDGSKNPLLDPCGLSWVNDAIEVGSNDISNTLE